MTTMRFRRFLPSGFACATPLAILITVLSADAHARPQPQPQSQPQSQPQGPGASASDATRQKAEQLFAKGVAAMQKKDWATAYQAFDESFAQRASHDAAANLAQAAFKLNRFAVAAQYFSVALRMMPTSEPPKRKAAVERAFEEAKKEVAAVSVTVEPADARVLVDGTPQPFDAVFLEPGDHTIEARAEGFETKREKVVAVKGGDRRLAFRLQKAKAPAGGEGGAAPVPTGPEQGPPPGGAASADKPDESSARTTVLIAEGVIAAVGLGVGVGYLFAKSSAEDDRDRLKQRSIAEVGANGCASQPEASVCVDLEDAADRARKNATLSTVGFVGAGVAVIGLGATWLLWPSPKSGKPRVAVDPMRRSVMVTGQF